jgi:hypothetical protein
MNAIASLTRHFLTTLAGLGGFLFANGLIPAEAVAQANEAGAALVDPLTVIAGLLAAGGLRLAIFCLGKIFPAVAEKLSGASGGMPLLMVGLTTAAFMGALPSCSAAQLAAARAVPVRSCVETDYGTVCYSSKSGVAVTVDATSRK